MHDVVARVALALLGLPARRRLRLSATPDGIMISPPVAVEHAAPAGAAIQQARGSTPEAVCADSGTAPTDSSPAEHRHATRSPRAVSTPLALVSAGAAPALAMDAEIVDPNEAARAADAALPELPAAEHARLLLARLQADSDTVGVVPLDLVEDVYSDMLIELQIKPRAWNGVSCELRRLTSSRKRYVNTRGSNGKSVKQLVFDIPAADGAGDWVGEDGVEVSLARSFDDDLRRAA